MTARVTRSSTKPTAVGAAVVPEVTLTSDEPSSLDSLTEPTATKTKATKAKKAPKATETRSVSPTASVISMDVDEEPLSSEDPAPLILPSATPSQKKKTKAHAPVAAPTPTMSTRKSTGSSTPRSAREDATKDRAVRPRVTKIPEASPPASTPDQQCT